VTLLLDTHVFLWWRLDSRRLTRPVRNAIATADVVWVSAASAWEVAIKQHLGKIQLEDSFASMVEGSDFHPLPITLAHADRTADLPPHHMDPFDRMLISQAIAHGFALVTPDPSIAQYPVRVIW